MQLFPGKSICFFFGTPCAAFAKASTNHGRIGAGEKVLKILRKSARSAGKKTGPDYYQRAQSAESFESMVNFRIFAHRTSQIPKKKRFCAVLIQEAL